MALKTLSTRFCQNNILIEDNIDIRLPLTTVRTSADVERLRDLHDPISFRVNALEGLGVLAVEYTAVLHQVLMKALPSDLAIYISHGLRNRLRLVCRRSGDLVRQGAASA